MLWHFDANNNNNIVFNAIFSQFSKTKYGQNTNSFFLSFDFHRNPSRDQSMNTVAEREKSYSNNEILRFSFCRNFVQEKKPTFKSGKFIDLHLDNQLWARTHRQRERQAFKLFVSITLDLSSDLSQSGIHELWFNQSQIVRFLQNTHSHKHTQLQQMMMIILLLSWYAIQLYAIWILVNIWTI